MDLDDFVARPQPVTKERDGTREDIFVSSMLPSDLGAPASHPTFR